MGDALEKDAFYVVRKGDVVGIYKSLDDFSPLDHSISVYKGYGLSKEAESYLVSRGLKQANFSIGASDVQDGLFGALSVCPFQDSTVSSFSRGFASQGLEPSNMERKQNHVAVGSDSLSANSLLRPVPLRSCSQPQHQVSPESSSYVTNSQKRPVELRNFVHPQQSVLPASRSCIIEFDGASKGNPGLAGAGAVLRATDGNEVWRLREGVGVATNNVAEYRGVILGLRTALQKGFQCVQVRGDSQLVCFQVQGKWKTKNENMANLCKVAKELAKQFISFTIEQIPREFNSDADAQANRAVALRDGQVEMEVVTPHV